jgi:lipopolysaccharide/colanic/teichoic acid biosynthesis glycosyltransferase
MTSRNLRNSILTADLVWGVLAMPLAYLMRYGWAWHGPADRTALIFVPPLMTSLLFWSLMSSWVRLDGFRTGWVFPAVVSQLLLAVSALMSALFAMGYLVRQFVSRLALGYFGLLLFVGFLAIRVIARSILGARRTQGLVRNVVIVGDGQLAREMTTKIDSHPEMLRKVVGFLSPGEGAFQTVPFVQRKDAVQLRTPDIVERLKSEGVDEIILTVPAPGHPEIVDLTSRCRRKGIAVSMVPQPYELYLTKPDLSDLDGIPLLQLLAVPLLDRGPFWKRGFDVAMTLVLLPVCVPPLLAGAAYLKLKKGRAFCCERRCGKFGEEFLMYRLDSPRRANELPGYETLLQKLSITELPQLFNVLRGDMSLVGPRPEGPDRFRHYTDWHRQRLNVTPGITGLAQVCGLRDQHSSEDKTRYDLQYILRRSLFQDISLLLQTGYTLMVRLVHAPRPESFGEEMKAEKIDISFPENITHAHSSQSSAD